MQHAIALPHAEIVHRQHIRPPEGEDQQHLHSPAADAANGCQPLDQRFVGHPVRLTAIGHGAVQRLGADVADRRDLAGGKAASAQRRLGGCHDRIRVAERSPRKQRRKSCRGSPPPLGHAAADARWPGPGLRTDYAGAECRAAVARPTNQLRRIADRCSDAACPARLDLPSSCARRSQLNWLAFALWYRDTRPLFCFHADPLCPRYEPS